MRCLTMNENYEQSGRRAMASRREEILEAMYLRCGYPLENRLLSWFGQRRECGCESLGRRRLRLCWAHSEQTDGIKLR